MTRETKIGLLVGLAFIIVIGILLAEAGRVDPQPYPLTAVVDNVRSGAATPHNDSTQDESVAPPAAPAPTRPVPTRDELRAETRVTISPAASAGSPATPGKPADDHPPVRLTALPTPNSISELLAPENAAPDSPTHSIPDTIDVQPRRTETPSLSAPAGPPVASPERLVSNLPKTSVPSAAAKDANGASNGKREYVAKSGDTLSKLAGRFLGANTKANRAAIIALNPSLQKNPNSLMVGRTYILPAHGAVAAPASAIASADRAAAQVPASAANPAIPSSTAHTPQYWYTVKEDDNLWRIAREQLGDPRAVAAIKELNRDVLKGKDVLRANMRLRLPAKPLASAN